MTAGELRYFLEAYDDATEVTVAEPERNVPAKVAYDEMFEQILIFPKEGIHEGNEG